MSQTPHFRTIDPEQLVDNPFRLIGKEWMLITAGDIDKFNMMTASWGGMGILWGRPVALCVIRPQRYTFPLMERSSAYTLTFFDAAHREVLDYCGSHSGRDVDKVAATGLTPIPGKLSGTTTFAQARMVIECRKIYFQDIDPSHFLDPGIHDNYPLKDYHRMYFGEVVNVLLRSE